MPTFLPASIGRILARLKRNPTDKTARRRRQMYQDKFWTAVEQLEDRTLLSGTAPAVAPVPPPVSTLAPVNAISAGDFNGDGNQDIVAGTNATSAEDATLVVALIGGQGEVTQTISLGDSIDTVLDVQVADIDGDGDQDFATASRTGGEGGDVGIQIDWWENDGTGTNFTRHNVGGLLAGDDARLLIADFGLAGDGVADLAAAVSDSANEDGPRVDLFLATSHLTPDVYNVGAFNEVIATLDGTLADLEAADLDRDLDGDLDLLVATNLAGGDVENPTNSGTVHFVENNGASFSNTPESIVTTSDIITGIEVALINGGADTASDLIVTTDFVNPATPGGQTTVFVDYDDGLSSFNTSTTLTDGAANQVTRQLTVADLDSDGDSDIVSLVENDGGREIAWYSNDGNGNFAASATAYDVSDGTNAFHAFFPSGEGGVQLPLQLLATGETVPDAGRISVFGVVTNVQFPELISRTGPNIAGNGEAYIGFGGSRQVSDDGRYVVFFGSASNLAADDTNNKSDVFVLDRQTDTIEKISVGLNGAEADGDSTYATMSADGRFIAYESVATNLVLGDTNGSYDIFVYDRVTETTNRVSVSSSGAQALGWMGNPNANSRHASISADGMLITFVSDAENLGPTNPGLQTRIYVHSQLTGQTIHVSRATDGAVANGNSINPSISADGRFVAFQTNATNFDLTDDRSDPDVYLRDLQTNQTTLVSRPFFNTPLAIGVNAAVSGDGRYVAFESNSDYLVENEFDGLSDIFRFDRVTSEVILVSVQGAGEGAYRPSISDDGNFIAYEAWENGTRLIYATDVTTGQTTLVSQNADGEPADGFFYYPSVNGTGEFIAIRGEATNLVPNYVGVGSQVYLTQRQTETSNTAPAIEVNTGATVNEGEIVVIDAAALQATDAEQAAAEVVYTVTAAPQHGVLRLDLGAGEYDVLEGTDTFTQADIDAGLISYLHDGGETTSDSFSFTVTDGADTTAEDTFALAVTPVNDAPAGTDNTVSTNEDTPYVFTTADFGFSDPVDLPPNALLSVLIATVPLPEAGTLTKNGEPIVALDSVSAADIAAGRLVFTPNLNESGAGYASFTFQVRDDGGTANGGANLDQSPNTMTIDVTPVNDAPVVAVNETLTVDEEGEGALSALLLQTTDVDVASTENLVYSVTAGPAHGTLWKDTIGGPVEISGLTTFTQADIDAGLVRYEHDGSETTSDSFAFAVSDGEANPVEGTFRITVTPVADTPTIAVSDASTNEDTTVALDVSAELTSVNGREVRTVVISGIPVGAVLTDGDPAHVFPAGVDGNGDSVDVSDWNLFSLTFTPPSNLHSTPAAPFTLTVTATATEPDNNSEATVSRTLDIVVNAVADSPDLFMNTVEGTEDQPIAIDLSHVVTLNDTDGSESVTSLLIIDVPAGAVITDGNPAHVFVSGQYDADLDETITSIDVVGWDLAALTITPPPNSDIDFILTIIATVTDAETEFGESGTAVNQTTFRVKVIAETDAPTLDLTNATGNEIVEESDTIPLSINAALTDLDGSESLTLFIKGIPEGAVLSDGAGGNAYPSGGATADPEEWIDITDWNWSQLTIRPTQYDDTDFTLTVKAVATEGDIDDPVAAAVTESTLFVNVKAVANAPNLTVVATSTNEDETVLLDVTTSRVDDDGSETLALVVSGIPVGATITDGTPTNTFTASAGNTSTNITTWDLAGLRITPPENDSRNFALTFTSTTTETDAQAAVPTATTEKILNIQVHPVNDAPVVSDFTAATIDQALSVAVDLRTLVTDVETADDDLVFQIVGVTGGLAMGEAQIAADGHTAIFIPNPDFVGIATFTFSVTDAGDSLANEPDEADTTLLTRTGTVDLTVLRFQDLGDAPESYGTLGPDQQNPDLDGARHGGSHLNDDPVRLGSAVGFGEANGQPSEDALGDDAGGSAVSIVTGLNNRDAGDDEDGVIRLANLAAAGDRDIVRTLRIEAPAGGMLDAWIDFNRNGVFDDGEHLFEGQSIALDESNASEDEPGVYYVKFTVPQGAMNFDGGIDETGEPIVLNEAATYARFRISTEGGLAPTGFAADGEVEDYLWVVRNVTGATPSFDGASDLAIGLFVDSYAAELIEDPDYAPPPEGVPGHVPFVFSGSGTGDLGDGESQSGPTFKRGETDPALDDIVARVNSLLSQDRAPNELMFVFVIHPVDFVITDPAGRQVGQVGGQQFNDIGGNVSYTGSGPVELLVIRGASAGEYKMEFTGTGGVFRGGATLITSEGQQLSTFQGALAVSQTVQLALDFTAPSSTVLTFDDSANAGGANRGQVFFNIDDNSNDDGEEEDLSALLGLDSENDSGDLDPRAELKKWIKAVSDNAQAGRRILLDELTPDWIAEHLPESQELIDEFWSGLGQSLLGGIPGQVFHLSEFLGVDVPLLFAPPSEGSEETPMPAKDNAPAGEEGQTAIEQGERTETAATQRAAATEQADTTRFFFGSLASLGGEAGLDADAVPLPGRREFVVPVESGNGRVKSSP